MQSLVVVMVSMAAVVGVAMGGGSPLDLVDCAECVFAIRTNIGFMAYPFDCTKYVMCVRHEIGGSYYYEKYDMPCPGGTGWDQTTLTCDVGDCNNFNPIPTHEDVCNAFPDEADPEKYYVEDGDKYIHMSCPDNLWFNATECVCDYHPGWVAPLPHACQRLAYFPFDQDYVSQSVQHMEATPYNSMLVPGYIGNATQCTGAPNSFVKIGFFNNWYVENDVTDFAVLFWIRPDAPISAVLQGVLSNGDCGEPSNVFATLLDGHIDAQVEAAFASDFNTYTTGSWYHVAIVYSSGIGIKLYVNNVLVGTTFATGAITNRQCALTLCQIVENDFVYPYTGLIDELYIYDCPITAADVEDHYNNFSP